ncbi:hypothetical protein N9L68_05920 [bacterium]|nr:hypothetical protein [bacterium]
MGRQVRHDQPPQCANFGIRGLTDAVGGGRPGEVPREPSPGIHLGARGPGDDVGVRRPGSALGDEAHLGARGPGYAVAEADVLEMFLENQTQEFTPDIMVMQMLLEGDAP